MGEYEITIGLEIHAELKTKTKVFCSCKNEFGAEPNINICPVCIGLPGALPILSKKAIELTIKAGHCIGSEINDIAIFERKSYFYPDLSKSYQISQLQKPICLGGEIKLENGKVIRLNRIHLEEDAGKLIHVNDMIGTLIDYNRGGTALIETVTEPDISSAAEAVEFLQELRSRFVFSDVADCKMEEGGLRCDVNLSVRKKGETVLGTRTEMKNLNSFKMIYRAIEFESARQIELLKGGGKVVQETRKWDDNKGRSLSMRNKEEAADYRYMPDPDIFPVKIEKSLVDKLKKEMPRLAHERREQYVNKLGLPPYDAKILTAEKYFSDYFEECLKMHNNPKNVSNWVMTEVLRKLKESEDGDITKVISVKNLADIMKMVEDGKITRANAKEIFEQISFKDMSANDYAKEHGMLMNSNTDDIKKIIDEVIAANPEAIKDYETRADRVINFFTGQIMKITKGTAKLEIAKPILIEKLNEKIK